MWWWWCVAMAMCKGSRWWWRTCGVVGVMCGTDMFDLFSAVAGVVTPHSFTINPPSTNSRIVCRRKDRGGCGCLRRWLLCFRFCLFWWQTPRVTMCSLFLPFWWCILLVLWWWWRCVVVVVFRCLAAILFGVIWCFSGVPGLGVPFWFGPKVWWADHFWFEIGSQFFGSCLVLGFLWFLLVDRRSTHGGNWMIFRIGVFQRWLSFGVQDWEFSLWWIGDRHMVETEWSFG